MSTAELKELRQEVKQYIDHADERVVKMMYAMLETMRMQTGIMKCLMK